MIESTEACSRIGSQLSNFIANRSQRFTQKLLRYKETGMTRFEITVYGTELFSLDDKSASKTTGNRSVEGFVQPWLYTTAKIRLSRTVIGGTPCILKNPRSLAERGLQREEHHTCGSR